MEFFSRVVGVIVDVNVGGFGVAVETIKVEAFFFVYAEVVTNDNMAIGPFHDAAEPEVIVAVIVLDEGVNAVVVGIISATVHAAFAGVSVGFVVLDFDPISGKAKDAVTSVIATAIGQCIAFVDRIFTGSCDDVVSASSIDEVVSDVNIRP